MHLSPLDWGIMLAAFAAYLAIGWWAAATQADDYEHFFLGGRSQPWWLLGISMLATTFAADTPNLVTGIVRERGVFGNWAWCAFLLTGSVTTFFFAALWRRSGVLTDIEFYEARYSGRSAAFLRGLLVTSPVAASMSTMSTAVNWGSRVVVNDLHRRFIDPAADQRRQVWVGQLAPARVSLSRCGRLETQSPAIDHDDPTVGIQELPHGGDWIMVGRDC